MNGSITSKKSTSKSKAIEITQMALMIAIICAATILVIRIPSTMGVGYCHIGDSMVFLSAILFGKKRGFITSALGMGLADILSGYAYYMPFTFVIKGIMALIVASIAYRGNYNAKNIFNNIFAFIIAGIFMILSYFIADIFIVKLVLSKVATYKAAMIISLANIPGNIVQALVGILIAVPAVKLLQGRIKIVK